ncbi:MAG: hypothetical protein DWQ06_14000 [Calditrichaeota bacterium]|nr:MAG: hypothetical protein DWQ06_14000 [Calditrichota bacterium]
MAKINLLKIKKPSRNCEGFLSNFETESVSNMEYSIL